MTSIPTQRYDPYVENNVDSRRINVICNCFHRKKRWSLTQYSYLDLYQKQKPAISSLLWWQKVSETVCGKLYIYKKTERDNRWLEGVLPAFMVIQQFHATVLYLFFESRGRKAQIWEDCDVGLNAS